MAPKGTDDIQEMLNNFVQTTSKLLYQVGDTLKEQAVKSKDLVEEKLKERELNVEFSAFGKEVFKLVAAGKVELPESMTEQLDKIRAMVKEIDDLRSHGAPKPEVPAASDKPADSE